MHKKRELEKKNEGREGMRDEDVEKIESQSQI